MSPAQLLVLELAAAFSVGCLCGAFLVCYWVLNIDTTPAP